MQPGFKFEITGAALAGGGEENGVKSEGPDTLSSLTIEKKPPGFETPNGHYRGVGLEPSTENTLSGRTSQQGEAALTWRNRDCSRPGKKQQRWETIQRAQSRSFLLIPVPPKQGSMPNM